jgi:hypothetical protein
VRHGNYFCSFAYDLPPYCPFAPRRIYERGTEGMGYCRMEECALWVFADGPLEHCTTECGFFMESMSHAGNHCDGSMMGRCSLCGLAMK